MYEHEIDPSILEALKGSQKQYFDYFEDTLVRQTAIKRNILRLAADFQENKRMVQTLMNLFMHEARKCTLFDTSKQGDVVECIRAVLTSALDNILSKLQREFSFVVIII